MDGPRVAELLSRCGKALGCDSNGACMEAPTLLIRPEAITDELCLRYYNERRGTGAAIGTINNELTYLRASLKFAFRNRWIDAEPRVLVPRRPPTTTN